MALDLGLCQKPRASASHIRSDTGESEGHSPPEGSETKDVKDNPRPILSPEKRTLDSSTLESRRTLLACYVFCAR